MAAGGEFDIKNSKESDNQKLPFGGGGGAGVSVQPVAFMVVGQGQIRLLSINQNTTLERVIDLAPQVIDQISKILQTTAVNILLKLHRFKQLTFIVKTHQLLQESKS